jgi:hypothetical protein
MFVMGAMTDENMTGRAQIILVATGVGAMPMSRPQVVQDAEMEMALPVAAPAPATHGTEAALAHSLFAGAQPSTAWVMADAEEQRTSVREGLLGNPKQSPVEEEQFVSALPALSPDNLDLPAFLRRRRSVGPQK